VRCSQGVPLAAGLLHDLGGQVPPGLAVLGFLGYVVAVQGELVAQPGGRAAGPGRAELPCCDEQLADLAAGQHPGDRADRSGRVQVAEPAEERLDVPASQRGRVVAAIRALAQAFGQQGQAGQVVAGLVAAAAAEMPRALLDVSHLTPLGAAVQAIQSSLLDGFPPIEPLLVLAAYAILFSALAVRFFRWE